MRRPQLTHLYAATGLSVERPNKSSEAGGESVSVGSGLPAASVFAPWRAKEFSAC
jgi:hypothetical protein